MFNFDFDLDFANELYNTIESELEVTRSDAQGIVEANGHEIQKLYECSMYTIKEIITIIFNNK